MIMLQNITPSHLDDGIDKTGAVTSKAYWDNRLASIPLTPQLPFIKEPVSGVDSNLSDKPIVLIQSVNKDDWLKIKNHALTQKVMPVSLFAATFADLLGRWASRPDVTLNLKLLHGARSGSGINQVFTGAVLVPLAYTIAQDESWLDACKRIDEQLRIAHAQGPVSPQLVRQKQLENGTGHEIHAPVLLYTNLPVAEAGVELTQHNYDIQPEPSVETPWLQSHILETDDGIQITWEATPGVLDHSLLEDMFDGQFELLSRLMETPGHTTPPSLLSRSQRERREQVNDTNTPVEEKLLHGDFFKRAQEKPEQVALLWDEDGRSRNMSYGELADKALCLAASLVEKGVNPGDLVAVSLPRGAQQIVAVLAVLAAGATYVPIGVGQPQARQERIYHIAGLSHLVTDRNSLGHVPSSTDVRVTLVEEADATTPLAGPVESTADTLAYVIFTSGSTGEPKGVEITHLAAGNTVQDICKRFALNEQDRVLAVSALDFDLSVFDIFGLLSIGGALGLIEEGDQREAKVWLDLVERMQITLWNSVPAILDMLVSVAQTPQQLVSLRLAMASGDWIGLDLPGRLADLCPHCRFISLGGATEASIWSNYFEVTEVDPGWPSIPYGRPLGNQQFRVVDTLGRDCPELVAGELWIGGMGVARGYLGNPQLSAEQFIVIDAKPWYRTGDQGRYLRDGNLEFLGRRDHQVKLGGYRIELGEVEAALRRFPGVGQSIAALTADRGAKHLVAAVVPETASLGEIAYTPDSQEHLDADLKAARASYREIQSASVERVLVEILKLDTLLRDSVTAPWHPRAHLSIADTFMPVLRIWLRWLSERQLLLPREDGFTAGPRLSEVAGNNNRSAEHDDDGPAHASLIAKLRQHLLGRLTDYRQIMAGRLSPTVLLDDEVLSPESLSAQDPEVALGLQQFAETITRLACDAGQPLEVAVLGGRSGLVTEKLLGLLSPESIRCTLLESAASLLEVSRDRLGPLVQQRKYSIDYQKVAEDRVPKQLRYRFDLVLAVNVLHRYADPSHGCAIASLLLRRGGRLLALEFSELTPIALLTSVLLDGGFDHLDHDRRRANNPMLTSETWATRLREAGLRDIRHYPVGDGFTEWLEAACGYSRIELDQQALHEHAQSQLPAHMLPDRIEVLPWLPLSANGKLDRVAFAAGFKLAKQEIALGDEPHEGMEQALAKIWQRLLNTTRVGRTHSFFEAGGDSLLATRFVAAVKNQLGMELTLGEMFAEPNLAGIAAVLQQKNPQQADQLPHMVEGEI
jgi:dihydroaeruginoic acid synthetase